MDVNEKNFVKLLKRGDERALEYVVRTYGGLLKSVISRTLYKYPEDAEECLYDCILKIWENISSYDPKKASFEAWAAAVAKYRALDRLRSLSKTPPGDELFEEIISDSSVSDSLDITEFFSELVSCLNEEDKEIFARIFLYGQSPEETAKIMGKSTSAVYKRVSRGRRKMLGHDSGLLPKELKGDR